jgi:hypothetical protein
MDPNVRLRAIDKNIADCLQMIEKCNAQVQGFRRKQPTFLMSQRTIDKRVALFLRESEQWEQRLAKWQLERAAIVAGGNSANWRAY